MKYESMPREELIAELKAWEGKFNEKVIENKEKLRLEYQKLLKMTDEQKYQSYWLACEALYWGNLESLKDPSFSIYFANTDDYNIRRAYKELKEKYGAFDILYQRKNAGVK